MERIKECLRLHLECGRSQREIARALDLSLGAVNGLLGKARSAGLGWPLPEGIEEQELQERLYGDWEGSRWRGRRDEPDFASVRKELKSRKRLTLQLLWHEYREAHPDGYSYSRYCELYRAWKRREDLVMLQEHKPGEKLFVDYAGDTVEVWETGSEEARQAQVFVAVLGASSYFYTEATWGQGLEAWVGAHVRAFDALGGVSEVVVPDNLKSGVTSACRYEPVLNRTYQEMAHHYGVAVVPARKHRPRDKAKAEKCVQLVETGLLEPLRHRRFTSLAELNEALREGSERLNAKPFQRRKESRRDLFEELDQPALRPLPAQRYEYAEWKVARVNINYHIDVDGHLYSVPCELVQQQVDVRRTEGCVEVLRGSRRVALHARSTRRGGMTTDPAHRPKSHAEHGDWPPERIKQWAGRTGPATKEVVSEMLDRSPFPQERYASCLGLLRLSRHVGEERMEAAARRALHFSTVSYKSIRAILESGADRQPLEGPREQGRPAEHANVRGGSYYGKSPEGGGQEA